MTIAGPRQSRTALRLATIAAALFVIALYVIVGFQSPGYDDEISNISTVSAAQSHADIVAIANTRDFHPPGQYLLNKFLFDLLGDWSWVRAVGAAVAALTLVAVWRAVNAPRAFAYLAICLNPAPLLWCTGLRWYGPFVVLINLVLLILLRPPRRPLAYWGGLFACLLALFHVGYLALLIAPVVVAVALHQRRATLARELPVLMGAGLIAAVLALPQLTVFFAVHLKDAGIQTAGLLQALGIMALQLSSGPAAMPTSIAGLALAAANLTALLVALRHWRSVAPQPATLVLGGSVLAILACRIGGKLHTLVTLSSLQGIVQAKVFGRASGTKTRPLLAVLFAIGNIGGLVNVATHTNTTKGGWNTPYPLVFETFAARTAGCAATTAIAHDPVLAYHLRRQGIDVIAVEDEEWRDRLRTRTSDCLVAFQTFRGSLSKGRAREYAALLEALPGRVSVDRLGHDAFAAFKRRFDPDVPDDYVTMTLFRK